MLNTLRRDRRTRRQASFNLETLDDRLVLSAAAAGAVAGVHEHRLEVKIARHEARLDRLEARHEAKLATKEAKQEAMISQLQARPASLTAGDHQLLGDGAGIGIRIGSAIDRRVGVGVDLLHDGDPHGRHDDQRQPESEQLRPRPTPSPRTSTGTGTGTGTGSSTTSPGPLSANVAAALQSLYQEYENAGGGSTFTPSQPSDNQLQISGTSVGVNLKMGSAGDFSTFLSQLQSDGLQVSSSSATYGLVDGMLPIGDLPTIAQVAASVTPMSRCRRGKSDGPRTGMGPGWPPPRGPARAFLCAGATGRDVAAAGTNPFQTIDAGPPGGLA